MAEYITIKILSSELEKIRHLLTEIEYKEVSFKDEFFANDLEYKVLMSASVKAYKALKKYEFDKRNRKPNTFRKKCRACDNMVAVDLDYCQECNDVMPF